MVQIAKKLEEEFKGHLRKMGDPSNNTSLGVAVPNKKTTTVMRIAATPKMNVTPQPKFNIQVP